MDSFLYTDPLNPLSGVNPANPSLAGVPGLASFAPGVAQGRCCSAPMAAGMDPSSMNLLNAMTYQNMLTMQLIQMLLVLMMGMGRQGLNGLSPSNLGNPGQLGGVDAAGASPGTTGGSGSPGGVTGGGSPDSSGASTAQSSPAGSTSATGSPGAPQIAQGTKVLMIGDSHTVGTFGTELDKLMRNAGAQVSTYGSSGSSPSWWVNGTATHSGFVARRADGSVEQPPWNQTHETPRLADLIARERPDVVVVNLGANFRGSSPEQVKQQVASLGEICKRAGTKLVWVGPPPTREDQGNPGKLQQFNQALQAAVAPYGTFIPSSQFIDHYSGSDGLHYNGGEGTELARKWAQGVFNALHG